MLKKLIWKFRYAMCMHAVSACGLRFGWYYAGVAVESCPEWIEENPEDMAYEDYEEMSYWDDDGDD